jgi:predicted transcriptional regulator
MSESTTLTIRLRPEVKLGLSKLSESTKRTRSYLAAEAIAAYVERETAIIDGINRGVDDLRDRRLVPHGDAMAEIDAVIASAHSKPK